MIQLTLVSRSRTFGWSKQGTVGRPKKRIVPPPNLGIVITVIATISMPHLCVYMFPDKSTGESPLWLGHSDRWGSLQRGEIDRFKESAPQGLVRALKGLGKWGPRGDQRTWRRLCSYYVFIPLQCWEITQHFSSPNFLLCYYKLVLYKLLSPSPFFSACFMSPAF